jgi:hypothetical protein
MSDLDDFRTKTLAREAEAEAALHAGGPAPRMAMWSRRDPVTLSRRSSGAGAKRTIIVPARQQSAGQ